MIIAAQRALIFDFGGVLMKTVDYAPRHAWDAQLGLSPGSVERVVHGSESWRLAQCGQLSTADYWQDVAQQLGLSQAQVEQLAVDFYSGDQLDMALIDYLRQVRRMSHPVALLSNDVAELTEKLRRNGIHDLFNPLVISAQIGVMKPAPGAYHAVLKALHLPAEAAIFVDDRLDNVEGARQVGMQAIHYTPDVALIPLLDAFMSGSNR
ncbi:MAG: HAD family phosphatase [bacterium]|nr:HAD family phosphatase [bacterium]